MNISIPEFAMVLLIGVSGSGKTTFARRHFLATEIISSDHCRALICDDENDQSVNREAFEILHLIAAKRLAHRNLTVIDATNVQPEARRSLLDLAMQFEAPTIAIILDVDEAIFLRQNENRQHRVVDREIIFQQRQSLQESLEILPQEGFQSIYLLTTPEEIDAVKIQRI